VSEMNQPRIGADQLCSALGSLVARHRSPRRIHRRAARAAGASPSDKVEVARCVTDHRHEPLDSDQFSAVAMAIRRTEPRMPGRVPAVD